MAKIAVIPEKLVESPDYFRKTASRRAEAGISRPGNKLPPFRKKQAGTGVREKTGMSQLDSRKIGKSLPVVPFGRQSLIDRIVIQPDLDDVIQQRYFACVQRFGQ